MANGWYDAGREGFAAGSVDWDADTIKCVAVDAGYTANLGTHDFLDDVGAGARVFTSAALTGKGTTDGYLSSAAISQAAVPAGDTITGLVFFKDTGVESTSRLLFFYDTEADASAIDYDTDGGTVEVAPATNGWARL